MATGGIVLAGGRSSRMGTAKAGLEWHGSTLLRRVAGLVGRAAGPVVVVRAPGQALPPLPEGVRVVEDAREGEGPLQGLLAGLEAHAGSADAVFVAAVDLPLLRPALVVRALAALAPGVDAAVPREAGRAHPLAAAYRPGVAPLVAAELAAGRRRAVGLLDRLRVAWLEAGPDDGLQSLNDPAAYAAARARPAPAVRVAVEGGPPAPRRAATLGAAAGPRLAGMAARVAGVPVPADPALPLAEGDLVELRTISAG
jgi:molybdopterin-guanine dinucleotide biosynthesis protein A